MTAVATTPQEVRKTPQEIVCSHIVAGTEPAKSSEKFLFACRLLETFGIQYQKRIAANLKKTSQEFQWVRNSYLELQSSIERGQEPDMGLKHTKVAVDRMDAAFGKARSREGIFKELVEGSYNIEWSIQRMLMDPRPNRELFNRKEKERKAYFDLFFSALNPNGLEEKHSEWTEEQKRGVAQIYFNVAAFYEEGEPVFFSELVDAWGYLGGNKGAARKALLEQLPTQWLKPFSATPPKPSESMARWFTHRGESFREFFIQCAVDVVEKQLQVKFSDTAIHKFGKNLSVVLDVCWLLKDLKKFYTLNLEPFRGRASYLWLLSIQLFMYLDQTYPVADRDTLFDMVIHRENPCRLETDHFFCTRSWKEKEVAASGDFEEVSLKENPYFAENWLNFGRLRDLVKWEPEDPYCWALFDLLFMSEKHSSLSDLLKAVPREGYQNLTVKALYDFCSAIENGLTPDLARQLSIALVQVNREFERRGIQMKDTEVLFMEKPLETLSLRLIEAGKNTGQFIEFISPYNYPMGAEYFRFLRLFLSDPERISLMFRYLKDKDLLQMGDFDANFFKVFHKEHRPAPLTPEERNLAIQIVNEIQKPYRFTNEQIFSLYLEITRLVKEETLPQVSRLIGELRAFCSELSGDLTYFLYVYYPNIKDSHLNEFVAYRNGWIYPETQLDRFILDPEKLQKAWDKIEELALLLSAKCLDPEIKPTFENKCREALSVGFFPPRQALGHLLCDVSNVTPEEGIVWNSAVWKTHLGQLKMISPTVGSYFHWHIIKDRPVLFISYIDLDSMQASSSFHFLDISIQELKKDDQRRKTVYTLLSILGRYTLSEKLTKKPPEDAQEGPALWTDCFLGLKEDLAHYDAKDLSTVWAFVNEVKTQNRRRFYERVARLRAPYVNLPLMQIAAKGNIDSSHLRGSLVPLGALGIKVPHYIPDASEEFIRACQERGLFNGSTRGFTSLNLDLHVAPDAALPIDYQVQTIEDLSEEPLKESEQEAAGVWVTMSVLKGEVKAPRWYPPEVLKDPKLFKKYFDAQNLHLKAAYYQHALRS